MSTQKIQTIKLPSDKKVMHIRKPSSPIHEVRQIYEPPSCKQTQPAAQKYVVHQQVLQTLAMLGNEFANSQDGLR